MTNDRPRSASKPIESGSRLAFFRAVEIGTFILLSLLVWAFLWHPWANAEETAKNEAANSASCRQGLREVASAAGIDSADAGTIKAKIEASANSAKQSASELGLCQGRETLVNTEKDNLQRDLTEYTDVFGEVDVRMMPVDADSCRFRYRISNQCSAAITFQLRTPGGEWATFSLNSGQSTVFTSTVWCDRNEAYFRSGDSQYPSSSVYRIGFEAGTPVSEPSDDYAAMPRRDIACISDKVVLTSP